MAIDPAHRGLRRRQVLVGAGALLCAAMAGASPRRHAMLACAWDDAQGRHHVGLLQIDGGSAHIARSIEVPSRAHGLACGADGSVLAVARRPGDWLLRWQPGAAAAQAHWLWADGERRFNGHVLVAPDGQAIYTTEFDLEGGQGRLVRREATSLQETAVWPTHGLDPHDMEWLPGNRLLVANGGITTLPETGRVKRDLDRMDPSLVRLDLATGAIDGQWRLADARLSIRHLARHADGLVAVALQAEHDDPAERAAAPLLALFDPANGLLQETAPARTASGYGGDVAAVPGGWLLSCPREHQVQRLSPQGRLESTLGLDGACALAPDAAAQGAWVLGRLALRRVDDGMRTLQVLPLGSQFDNHAVPWPGPAVVAS